MSIESVIPSTHLILCHPLLLLPPIPPSIRVFSNESVLPMRWPKYWSVSFSISPSNEHPGLVSFRMHWLDLLAVQGTLKNLLQHHSSKASILWCSAFFMDQLSHPYMTTGKATALTRWTFVGKAMSLLFNMLSRLVITFLPRSKHTVGGYTSQGSPGKQNQWDRCRCRCKCREAKAEIWERAILSQGLAQAALEAKESHDLPWCSVQAGAPGQPLVCFSLWEELRTRAHCARSQG